MGAGRGRLPAPLALDAEGSVWAFGANAYGQLGLGHEEYRLPVPIASLIGAPYASWEIPILQVSAGLDHSLLLTASGGVLAFGANGFGELGLGDSGRGTNRLHPAAVTGFGGRRVVEVSAGGAHSAAVDELGGLWTWGSVNHGALGHGEVAAPGEVDVHAKLRPTRVTRMPYAVRQVSAGHYHTLAVTVRGECYAWGDGMYGKLGLDDGAAAHAVGEVYSLLATRWVPQRVAAALAGTPVRRALAGASHSVVLTEAGEVYTMGRGDGGLLGLPGNAPRHVPTRVATGALAPPAVVVEVSVGASHTLARRADGAVVSWGHNWMGQLGIGGGEPRSRGRRRWWSLSGR